MSVCVRACVCSCSDQLSHEPGVHQLSEAGWSVSPKDLPVSASPVPGLRACAGTPGLFYASNEDLNSGLHACTAGALPTEPSP